jgi:membrane-associated protease RseP (regulator of RpoE activity)
MRKNSRSLAFAAVACLISLDSTVKGDQPPSDPSPMRVIDQFRTGKDGDALLLPVHIGKSPQTHLFLVDTGSERTLFDLQLRPHLGQPIGNSRVLSPGGTTHTETFQCPSGGIGKIPLLIGGPVSTVDLRGLRRSVGYDVRGVLGMDFLKRHVIHINFDEGALSFVSLGESVEAQLGTKISMHFDSKKTPYICGAATSDHADTFIIDTGATANTILASSIFDELAEQGKLQKVREGKMLALVGQRSVQRGRGQFVAVHGHVLRNPIVWRGDANYLGMGFWSRFLVTFDFPNETLYLKKSRRFAAMSLYDLSGLHLFRENGQTTIHSVDSESPAANAGINAGDEILRIDGTEVSEQSLLSIRRRLSAPKDRVAFVVRRNDRESAVSFSLR